MIESWAAFSKKYPIVSDETPVKYTGGRNLSVLLSLAAHFKSGKIAELYTAYGYTAVALAKAVPKARVYAYDVCLEYGAETPLSNEAMKLSEVGSAIKANPSLNIELHVAAGKKLSGMILLYGPYDLVFVDGNHSFKCALEDTRLATVTVPPGGVIVWDDYWQHCPGVMELIDRINRQIGDPIILVEGTRVCYTVLDKPKKDKLLDLLWRIR